MDRKDQTFNPGGRWAPTANVSLARAALEQAINRPANLPGIVAVVGPSGYGKSMAASYCANKFEGVYVECRSFFTRKTFALSVLKEMGIRPARTVPEMMEQAAEQLDLSQRPLIIDEGDYLLARNIIECVRDLHEMSRSTIMLIAEDQFPGKLLRASERFHNRVLTWLQAQPANMADAAQLARFYVPDTEIAEDLLAEIIRASGGVVRRVCVNLELVRQHCVKNGIKKINAEAWGKRNLYTGAAPLRRVA